MLPSCPSLLQLCSDSLLQVPLAHLCSLKPRCQWVASSSSFSSSCSLYSSLHLFQCLSIHPLHIYLPLPPPPLLLFFQHPLLHLLLLLTPSQRCNSTLHIHSVISRSSDVRTSIPQIMCASIFIIFFLGGGGLKSVWKTEVGMRNCTHSDSEDTCRHRLQQKDTHSSSKVQTRKLFDRRQNKSLLHAKHERIRLMTRKLLVQVPNSQAKRAAASLALTLAQRAASYCEF